MMRDRSSVSWKEIFQQALDESDREKLHRLIRAAGVAIFLRREELGDSAEAREELTTMAVAVEALRSIRTHQLGDGGAAARRCAAPDFGRQPRNDGGEL
jgi:hypothetical protein